MHIVFWATFLVASYSYLWYPILLFFFARREAQAPEMHDAIAHSLTVVVTARNEATGIVEKLDDLLGLEYAGELEVLVVSDASDDGTDDLVAGYEDGRVTLLRQSERQGKEAGQLRGIHAASFDIIVFTDVATRIAPGSLAAIAAQFSDTTVGAVSSEDKLITDDGQIAGEGLYVRYEMALRRLESRLAGLVGLSGSFFAVRREVCQGWRTDVPSDLNVAFLCARAGYRSVSDPGVRGLYRDVRKSSSEYSRKRRTIIRGMAGLLVNRDLLNPLRYGWFAWQLWSHKVLRWAVPWALVLLFVSTVALVPVSGLARMALVAQLLFYAIAAVGAVSESARGNAVIKISFFFCQVNLAAAEALARFLAGERIVMWEPSKR